MNKITVVAVILAFLLLPSDGRSDISPPKEKPYTIVVAEHLRVGVFDARGREIRSFGGYDDLSGAQPLPDGRLLVCDSGRRTILELDRTGKTIWQYRCDDYPADARRLGNGNTLIALNTSGEVIEIDAEGNVKCRHRASRDVISAFRLPNGNTMIGEYEGRVYEANGDGKIVWELDLALIGITPWRIRPLDGGNVIVIDRVHGSVVEIDRDSRVLWSIRGLNDPRDAVRLSNGKTLIVETGANRIVEATHDGALRPLIDNLDRPYHIEIDMATR